MNAVREMELWRQLKAWPLNLFLLTVALSLWRAADQPSVGVGVGGTTASVVITDIVLVALAIVCAVTLAHTRSLPREGWAAAAFGAVLAVVILASSIPNGATAFVAAAKLVELAALSLGALLFIRSREALEALVDLLIAITLAADVVGLVGFVGDGGGRQNSFLGEHDFAALATVPLVYGLALLLDRAASRRRATIAIVAGAIGVILGAALASLVGLYVAELALLVVVALVRRADGRRVLATLGVVAVVTAGALGLRSSAGDLGFLSAWFGKPATRPGQYAGSWSQRLIFVYVGGRIFLDRPVVGTGWEGNVPSSVYARYLPDARHRFSDQPASYFPPAEGEFIPQQTYDQVLYELGLVGGGLLLGIFIALAAAAARAARAGIRYDAFLPAVWAAAMAGAIAGEGLFGGTPIAALFWLTIGLVPAVTSVAKAREQ